jgi:transcription initiation factor IIE alpha subunit
LCEPGSVEQLSSTLERLVSDIRLRAFLGQNARKKVVEKYTWELHTKRIIDTLKEVLNKTLSTLKENENNVVFIGKLKNEINAKLW